MTDHARIVLAALNAAAEHPDLNVWRDPAGDLVGPAGVLAAVAVDALRRSLLLAGTRTEEQFAAMYTLNGEMVSPYPKPTSRAGAEVLVKGNNVQRAVDPDWRVDCTVVRRQQHTTPWEPVNATCGKPGEYWPTGNLRIDLEPCDRQPGHAGRCNWKLPAGLPADIPPPSEETP